MKITDISSFQAAREAGLAKLLPARPRVAIGMGTCGSGNGAEGVYHAIRHGIDSLGLGIHLARCGCFGYCAEEPLVNVRMPGMPLVVLRRVRQGDVPALLDDIAAGRIPAELALCKIEEWDHITGVVRYGAGYPEIPSWNDVPFFKGQKKIVLRNCGLINPGDIEEYIAVGGYQALYKVLIDGNPELVIEQIKAAKLRGRGGAGYQTGIKWEFLRKAKADKKYVICNADEGDPGAYMNRNECESDPHSLLEGMIIGGLRDGRHRRHHLRARRVSAGGPPPEPGHRAGQGIRAARREHPRPGLPLRHQPGGGRRGVRVRRGNGAHPLAGRQSRPAHAAPALPRREGAVGQAHQHQQRRDLVQRSAHRTEGAGLVHRNRQPEEPRHQGVLAGRQGAEHRPGGNAAGHAAQDSSSTTSAEAAPAGAR